jgi:hypothetical protein
LRVDHAEYLLRAVAHQQNGPDHLHPPARRSGHTTDGHEEHQQALRERVPGLPIRRGETRSRKEAHGLKGCLPKGEYQRIPVIRGVKRYSHHGRASSDQPEISQELLIPDYAPQTSLAGLEIKREARPRQDHPRYQEQLDGPGVESGCRVRVGRISAGGDGSQSVVYCIERPHPGQHERGHTPERQRSVHVGQYLRSVPDARGEPLGHGGS